MTNPLRTPPIKLNQSALATLDSVIASPKYDRSVIKTGFVHIGVGSFHRSHQAYYMHQLFNTGEAFDWGIIGLGLMEYDRGIYEGLNQQNGLYTLITQASNGDVQPEIIGSIKEMLLAIDTPDEVLEKIAHPDTKIVSMTITEGGYNVNPNTGEFNFSNPDVQQDLAHPQSQNTVFGYLTEAFRKRRDRGLSGVTVLSCDNVHNNGDISKHALLSFAKKQNPDVAVWIESNITFPNSMVDRITPVTTDETRQYLLKNFGIKDALPVNCEPFIQWVIEDKFANGRPSLENVGVQFVADVTPYEEVKLRLLNAGHSIIGIIGAIHGYETIGECISDATIAKYLRAYLDLEATPTLASIKGLDVETYKDTLIDRFANPNIKDSVSRITSESSTKIPKFVIPVILDNLESGGPIRLGALFLAAWCYSNDKDMNDKGGTLKIIDVIASELNSYANKTQEDTFAFLALEEVFGSLGQDERFRKAYSEAIHMLYNGENVLQTIRVFSEAELT